MEGRSEESGMVATVENLRLELYLGVLCHYCDWDGHFVIVVLGPVPQGIAVVIQGFAMLDIENVHPTLVSRRLCCSMSYCADHGYNSFLVPLEVVQYFRRP